MAQSKAWKGAETLFRGMGLERASGEAEAAAWDAYCSLEDVGALPLFRIDTHSRTGDFAELVTRSEAALRAAAAGREIRWVNDPEGEWTEAIFVLGDEGEAVRAIRAAL